MRADESDKMRAVFEREKVVRRTPVKEALVKSTSFFRRLAYSKLSPVRLIRSW